MSEESNEKLRKHLFKKSSITEGMTNSAIASALGGSTPEKLSVANIEKKLDHAWVENGHVDVDEIIALIQSQAAEIAELRIQRQDAVNQKEEAEFHLSNSDQVIIKLKGQIGAAKDE